MSDFVVAIGLFFVIEGLIYALAPSLIRRMAEELPLIPDRQLRAFGLAAVGLGVFFVWMIRG
ncbi:DUF2065 domain-containing protein [Hoeflea poritis]|uniref:DUF2065 family protein n=1 Tax=Hoeflea poritis TaxID=2993659 RepID=A0ABT4VQZ9_9HYPH|nr:DUF2065 family protein [Hoeflea poritis]MDA4846443.1 DUF2065 family protein [Hoeflea poritis]